MFVWKYFKSKEEDKRNVQEVGIKTEQKKKNEQNEYLWMKREVNKFWIRKKKKRGNDNQWKISPKMVNLGLNENEEKKKVNIKENRELL